MRNSEDTKLYTLGFSIVDNDWIQYAEQQWPRSGQTWRQRSGQCIRNSDHCWSAAIAAMHGRLGDGVSLPPVTVCQWQIPGLLYATTRWLPAADDPSDSHFRVVHLTGGHRKRCAVSRNTAVYWDRSILWKSSFTKNGRYNKRNKINTMIKCESELN